MEIVGLYTAILMLWIVYLFVGVSRLRLSAGKSTEAQDKLERAIRAHGNAVENVPFILFGLGLLAYLGFHDYWLHGIGVTLIIARVLQAIGLKDASSPLPPTRLAGNVMTLLLYVLMAGLLVGKFAKSFI